MAKAVLEAEVEGVGKILGVDAPFDEALASLKTEGVKYPISARDLAYSRIQKGKRSSLSTNGSYTKEGFLYAKDSPVLVSLASPLLNLGLAREATQANRNGSYFSTQDIQIYDKAMTQAEKDKNKSPEKRKVLILPSRNNFSISATENFDVLQGLLKDQAEKYLEFNGQDIPVYLVDKNTVDSQKGTLLTQLWFRDLDSGSVLIGNGRNLDYSDRVRGVRVSGAEGTQKSFESYNPKQVQQYLSILEGVRQGRLPASKLDKLITDFQGLKE